MQFFIVVAELINLIVYVAGAGSWGWRLSLGFAFIPSFSLFCGGVFLPDSPVSLLERGYPEKVSPLLSWLESAWPDTQGCPVPVMCVPARHTRLPARARLPWEGASMLKPICARAAWHAQTYRLCMPCTLFQGGTVLPDSPVPCPRSWSPQHSS